MTVDVGHAPVCMVYNMDLQIDTLVSATTSTGLALAAQMSKALPEGIPSTEQPTAAAGAVRRA